MPIIVQISLAPEFSEEKEGIIKLALQKASLSANDISDWAIHKKSIDARKKPVKVQMAVALFQIGEEKVDKYKTIDLENVSDSDEIHIIGAGPAGLFAALSCLENGLKPVVYERGKDVRERRRDLAKLNKEHILNPESNYCFGEGGAGTYSDGKLYTRSTKRGDVNKILSLLVQHGADTNIMVNSHPHIGTNKLPVIISNIREAILQRGGKIHFNSKLTDFELENDHIKGFTINDSKKIETSHVVLATGHSARDIFYLLHEKKVKIENKPYSLGVRVEHPQSLINDIQYHGEIENGYLPPASYSLVNQVGDRGVYSFCMCPGGIIAPCATETNAVVSNGWSPSKRNNPFANSGIVAEIKEKDLTDFENFGPLRGLKFQEKVETDCWKAAGKTQAIPAQRLLDFIDGRLSKDLPKCSYVPGIVPCRVDEVLPKEISIALRKGFVEFGKKLKGYLTNEALVVAPESRTSSPVRIPRNEDYSHIEIKNLFPCGEGAGYAGGIMSAAIDGMKIIESIKNKKEDL